MMTVHWTPDEIVDALQMRAEGVADEEIAAILGRSLNGVRKQLTRYGPGRHKPLPSDANWQDQARLDSQKLEVALDIAIAKYANEHGLSFDSAQSWLLDRKII